ncbi:MAG: hypothetical protein HUU35_18715, partial [Armatimonadetes bacterium]|nr:hypothetical protein [Armatimonadota bacterium]
MPHLAQPGHGLRPVVLLVLLLASAQGQTARSTLVYPGPDGRLIYVADERGDTI